MLVKSCIVFITRCQRLPEMHSGLISVMYFVMISCSVNIIQSNSTVIRTIPQSVSTLNVTIVHNEFIDYKMKKQVYFACFWIRCRLASSDFLNKRILLLSTSLKKKKNNINNKKRNSRSIKWEFLMTHVFSRN